MDIKSLERYYKEKRPLGRWDIVSRIGSGGFGAVFRIEDHLNEQAALKIVKHSAIQKSKIVKERNKKLSEIKALKELSNHTNILSLHEYNYLEDIDEEYDQVDLYIFIKTEIAKCSLRDKIGTNLTDNEKDRYIKDILDGIEYIHSNGLIHRDLKPENILINFKDEALISDFGSVKRKKGSHSIAGTGIYIAPEVLIDSEPCQKTDIFSLGVLLYELYESRVPFADEIEVDDEIYDSKFRRLLRETEVQFDHLKDQSKIDTIKKCLSYEYDNRVATIAEVREGLTKAKIVVDTPDYGDDISKILNTKPKEQEAKSNPFAPKERYYTLKLNIEPEDAEVYVDGSKKTNESKQKEGKYHIEIRCEGYISQEAKIELDQDIEYSIELEIDETLTADNYFQKAIKFDKQGKYKKAIKWYRKAAEQGNASAQNNLGFCYEYGEGVEQDYEEAIKWYRKAAEQGNASAQYSLDELYKIIKKEKSSNKDVWEDPETGLIWYTVPSEKYMNWEDAKEYARELRVDGRRWRLPTIEELSSIGSTKLYSVMSKVKNGYSEDEVVEEWKEWEEANRKYKKRAKNGNEYYIKEPFLDKIPKGEYYFWVWSSTEENTSYAWFVDFGYGHDDDSHKANENYVLCVADSN
jgi:serine/threonine protein kinase